MLYTSYCLNGLWEMDYRTEAFSGTENPWRGGFPMKNAVPGYWEDMRHDFLKAPFYSRLAVNPDYGNQRYPMTATPPDMALPTIPGTFFYHRYFKIDALEGEWELHFGGVQNSVWVWLNGAYLGCHRGYSTPFSMCIPKSILREENSIVMVVSNLDLTGFDDQPVSGLTNRAACQYTGGITGDVELRCYHTMLRDVVVEIDKNCDQVTVHLESEGEISLHWQVLDENELIMEGDARGDFSFSTYGLSFWSPESPKLYTLRVCTSDVCLIRQFGIRRLIAYGTGLRLNRNPYYLRGVCEHCYYPLTIHPSTDLEYYRNIIRKFKKLGFNFIRFHTHVPPDAYMQAADELGILLQVESPNYTSHEEYDQIVRFCRRHTSVVIYCCGNELEMDESFIDYLAVCANIVHKQTDALFSPMSALRGVEYFWQADEKDSHVVSEPFLRHPLRQEKLNSFSDLYNSYTLGRTSYHSLTADEQILDEWSKLYRKPRLSHEIGIQGTYTDLSLSQRYGDSPVGHTQMFSSIEEALRGKGLLEKAPLFFVNSCQWQRRLRKHCFESTRLCRTLAGYDFLGPIDTHWHTFGYDVGMMNEFYEMKPGESEKDVRMYNSSTVLLSTLGTNRVFFAGKDINTKILVSHFGEQDLKNAKLSLRLYLNEELLNECQVGSLEVVNGTVSQLYDYRCALPKVIVPGTMRLHALLECGDVQAENEWELYLFPEVVSDPGMLVINPDGVDSLCAALDAGKNVLIMGNGPFRSIPTSFQISLAGRTVGNLATVIAEHPAIKDLPHEGFCGWQFRWLMEGGSAITFGDGIPFDPIIEVASTPKNPIRQAILFEFGVGKGRLLVCGFHFDDNDPAACWLKAQLIAYAQSEMFSPTHTITKEQLHAIMGSNDSQNFVDTNRAINLNDKAAVRKKRIV